MNSTDSKAAGAGPEAKPRGRKSRCPVCSAPASAADAPFCSPRCADVDLNRWLTGSYAIPGPALTDEELD